MIGGMITAPLLSMLVIPAAYYLMRRRSLVVSEKGKPIGLQASSQANPVI
jgi:Cu(I)/Ag(I) efflux system membrane protein CusA/SilA